MERIAEFLECIPKAKTSTIIIGDLNIDNLVPSIGKSLLNELITSHNIRRVPLPPTRITPHSATSIDAVCTTLDESQISVHVFHTGISDHTGQLCRLNLPNTLEKPTVSTRRHLNPNSLNDLKLHLPLESWDNVLETVDIDQAYGNLLNSVTIALDHACPEKKSRKRRKKRMIPYDEETNELKEKFIQANNLFLTNGSSEDKARANGLKKAYDMKLRSLRRKGNADYIASANNKSKAIWNVINQERKSKLTFNPEIKSLIVDDRTVVDPVLIAQSFNEYFTTVAAKTLEQNQITPSSSTNPNNNLQPTLSEFSAASMAEISKIIDNLKIKDSAGLDEISSRIAKHCKEELLLPLLHITNLSVQLGSFPSRMKTSKVFPLHKRGKKDIMDNYRPISLVPTFSKIIERVVLKRLLQFLNANKLLTEYQHGFKKGKSTITALVDLIEDIINNLENGHNATGIFIDMSKAFDCLSHDFILNKLGSLGICGKALQWFTSYLGDRTQIVELGYLSNNEIFKVRSTSLPVSRGVPQGSVMGPVIFTLFTNDFPAHVSPYGRCHMYADDSVILSSNKSIENLEIESKMRYAIVLWGGSSRTSLDRVLVLQKRTVRIMADLGARDSCRGAFVEWGIMTVVATYILEVIISSCSRGITRNAQIHDHNTRFANNFNLPSHRRTLFEKKPSYAGARYFNILPVELKMLPSHRLKPHLKQWLSLRPFYTVGEFLTWRDFGI
ncbi:uncharacterized protein LOC124366754 [Homalodisca vitripennis]|uniref:uncharacterized protein LOC124366754 n=1 Tax=Homalodisca vitripennis TaxID=197043 RepID=UPI001EEA0BB6|nr:uncharacterized protein LOC124366754 [Homalodisca vitripennis]